jgi:hypothetical protein
MQDKQCPSWAERDELRRFRSDASIRFRIDVQTLVRGGRCRSTRVYSERPRFVIVILVVCGDREKDDAFQSAEDNADAVDGHDLSPGEVAGHRFGTHHFLLPERIAVRNQQRIDR